MTPSTATHGYWTIWKLKISGKRAKISFYQRTLLFYDMYKCRHATLASQACESTLARPKHGQWYPGSGYEIAKALQAMQLWLSRTLRGIMLLEKLETKAHTHTHTQSKQFIQQAVMERSLCVLFVLILVNNIHGVRKVTYKGYVILNIYIYIIIYIYIC